MITPKLTIVIPTFNRPDMLPRALKSALNQTMPVKIVVADDGDVRSTHELLKSDFAEYVLDERIRHLSTFADHAWPNWRAGAQEAETEFVAWLQDDDVIKPTHAGRIIEAFDRFPDADVWMARLYCAFNGDLALWDSGNGPLVPMDFMKGSVSSYAEGSILASTSYFTSWSLAPALAFRNTPKFAAALEAMPEHCDIFVERLIPALTAMGGSFIADPFLAGYWVQHDDQLSHKQWKDQPAQTKVMIKALDRLMDDLPTGKHTWQESLFAWSMLRPTPHVVAWINQIDVTIKEGGTSKYAREVQQVLVQSLAGRVKFGYTKPWMHRAARWLRDKVAF